MGIRKYYWKIKDFLEDTKKKPISVIASRNGQLFELRDMFIGRIVMPVHELKELEEIRAGFQYNLPKIPGNYLEQIISFFRDYCERFETEVMIHVYYDMNTNQYILDCPLQYVCKSSVNSTSEPLNPRRFKKVMDIHSHNSMEAYFSTTDNNDEINPLLFGVVGTLDKEPTMIFRVGVNGYYLELPVQHLFTEFNAINTVSYPQEWKEKVVLKEMQ